ncbi:MAG: alkaline phosphatase family protein [Stigonema ocellatum SAG 48.90 = DSM 106950]|nr:alkaline phosphatase family protein [Stigonema ocellatum SAG 48.90 = DSM 106950]
MFNLLKRTSVLNLIGGISAGLLLLNQPAKASNFQHVLILSVDGLRSADILDPALQPYLTNINSLRSIGVTYPNAFTTSPSDSFPGTLSYLTGAGPATTGVYYDDTYARNLTAPIAPINGDPSGNIDSPKGTEATYFEAIDYSIPADPNNPDPTNVVWRLDGGGYVSGDPTKPFVQGNYGAGSIDPTRLPQNCNSGTCQPVYPWQYLKHGVNTIFNVAHNAGLYTAFSDKHAGAYNIVQGPGGNSINDYYSPEINASVIFDSNGNLVDAVSFDANGKPVIDPNARVVTDNTTFTKAYDDLKVNAILNEINGKNSLGTKDAPVPNIFEMNFQAVSVGQKALAGGIDNSGNPTNNPKATGATPSTGPSSVLTDALQHTDESIGKILTAIRSNPLLANNTLVILVAKHGQDPRNGVGTLLKDNLIPNAISFHLGDPKSVSQATQDDVSLVWLKDQSKISDVTEYLNGLRELPLCTGTSSGSLTSAPTCNPGIANVYSGAKAYELGLAKSPNPDNRTPDLFVQELPGYIFVGNPSNGKKISEHGALFTADATNIALVLGGAGLSPKVKGRTVNDKVQTTQIAVTVLNALGLDANLLKGVRIEGTKALPRTGINVSKEQQRQPHQKPE